MEELSLILLIHLRLTQIESTRGEIIKKNSFTRNIFSYFLELSIQWIIHRNVSTKFTKENKILTE